MKRQIHRIKVPLVGGTLCLLLAAQSVPAMEHPVNMTGAYRFDPADLSIDVGDTVTWSNQDSEEHTSTSDFGSTDPWDSDDVFSGETYSRQFNVPGTFGYHDLYYASLGMTGTIIVNNVVPPTLSSPIRPNNSQFQFTISGTMGRTYIIEISGNLTNWTAIATNIAPSNVFNFTNSNATNLTQFYRVKDGS